MFNALNESEHLV